MDRERAVQNGIARMQTGPLSTPGASLSVADLERMLLMRFPREDAEPWDKTGLSVGDLRANVKAVAVALDPTREAIERAAALGANVLVAHHPLLLAPPSVITPLSVPSPVGAAVWAAIKHDVAVLSFHTALDANPAGLAVLPRMLRLEQTGIVLPRDNSEGKGYGSLCRPLEDEAALTVGQLAARCTSVFGRAPRVWANDFSAKVESIATATGSAGDVVGACVARGVQVLVCGEVKYHAALDARQTGLSIIELGHDVSELPLCAPLVHAVESAGVDKARIHIVDQSGNWRYPEAIRI